MGAKVDGNLACKYHDLVFGPDGSCVHNPHAPITGAMRVRSFPTVERYRAVWIWCGDPSLADIGKLPDLSFLDEASENAYSSGYICGYGNYQLYTDNILDLTHADFLHPETLGTGGAITGTRAKVQETESSVHVKWHYFSGKPQAQLARRLPPGSLVDSWTEVDWTSPSILTLRNGSVAPGAGREGADEVMNFHAFTPETAVTTHYFYAAMRNFSTDDAALNAAIAGMRDRVFATEDEPMIKAQQERMGASEFFALKPALMRSDDGAVRARRILQRKIVEEQADVTEAAARAR